MANDAAIYQLPPRAPRVPVACAAGQRFAAWADAQLAALTAEPPSALAVHQTAVRLVWQFYYERQGSAPEHRDQMAEANGALCVSGVFLAALERLHERWLAVEKPQLTDVAAPSAALPAPQPPPPPTLGDVLAAFYR